MGLCVDVIQYRCCVRDTLALGGNPTQSEVTVSIVLPPPRIRESKLKRIGGATVLVVGVNAQRSAQENIVQT